MWLIYGGRRLAFNSWADLVETAFDAYYLKQGLMPFAVYSLGRAYLDCREVLTEL